MNTLNKFEIKNNLYSKEFKDQDYFSHNQLRSRVDMKSLIVLQKNHNEINH